MADNLNLLIELLKNYLVVFAHALMALLYTITSQSLFFLVSLWLRLLNKTRASLGGPFLKS